MEKANKSVCDHQHFNSLFDEYSETLRNYLFYKCGDLHQADDLTQDAFIKLWKNCKKILYEKAKGFLFAVAKNKFYNQAAHKKVVLQYAKLPHNETNNETPHYKMEENEFMDKLQIAIQQLPEGQREAFLLNRVDNKTYAEISVMLGISQTAVEKRMQKALIKMRKVISNI